MRDKNNSNSKPKFRIEVKKKLIELNMTQRELAKKLEMNENYLTDILNGRRSGKKYKSKILKILKINIEDKNN